jgi:alpha-L-fucosidase
MLRKGVVVSWLCLFLAGGIVHAETKKAFNERMRWWRDARFGMFIHWGAYAVPGGVYKGVNTNSAEWIMNAENIPIAEYEEFARQFDPQKFDARAWVQLAKSSGAKYIIITSKHHDGFSMWNSQVSSYDIADFTPFKRDVLKELAEACKKADMHLGFYHSIMDWHHPDAKGERFSEYRENYLKPQLRELLTGYGKVGVLWFDGEWIEEWTDPQGAELYRFVRQLQPNIIVNNRVGKGRNGMQGMSLDGTAAGDFGTPEQEILDHGNASMDWEVCMTTNDSWGYKKFDQNYKSTKSLVDNLIDIAAKGGNYLLNVGPDAEGVIPQASQQRFREIGKWLKVNGAAIYGTRTLPEYQEGENIRYTRSKDGKIIYAIAMDWPGKTLRLRYIEPRQGSKIYMLGFKKALSWRKNSKGEVVVTMPAALQRAASRPCLYAWTLKIRGRQLPVSAVPQIASSKKSGISRGLFVEEETVTLKPSSDDAVMRYTLNGLDPDQNSPIYKAPLHLSESTEIRCLAVEKGKVASPIAAAQFSRIMRVRHLMLEKTPSVKYPGWGELSLIDGQQGGLDYHGGDWIGFEGEDLDASIDLGETRTISWIRLSCLQDQNSWIFWPASLRLSISSDGMTYEPAGEWRDKTTPSGSAETKEIILAVKQKTGRYLRIQAANVGTCPDWHKGAGGKAWLFVDEIIIQ